MEIQADKLRAALDVLHCPATRRTHDIPKTPKPQKYEKLIKKCFLLQKCSKY